MKQEHFERLREAIEPLDNEERRAFFKEKPKITDKAYRWTLLTIAGLTRFVCDELYKYLDDTHIDTALRKIIKPLR